MTFRQLKQMKNQIIKEKITQIEAEMKNSNLWQNEPLSQDAYACKEAFCADTMIFEQWLQFIFIPRVYEILDTDGVWPQSSQVGVYAIKNTDNERLVRLLGELDKFICE